VRLYGKDIPDLPDFYRSYVNTYLELKQYRVEIGNGAVIYMASDLLPVDKMNWFVPAWLI